MAPPPAREAALPSVGALFNAVYKSNAAGERCAKHLWRLVQKEVPGTVEELLACVTHLLVTGEKAAPLERCVRFLGTLAAHMPPGDEACAAALEALVAHLADQLQALDKVVRFRACQALALVLGGLPDSEGVSEELAEGLTDGLLERLQDKAPLVRAQAARALARLPAPDEHGCYESDAVVVAFQGLLLTEKSKDVRIAVLQSLPLATDTLPCLLERLRDVAPLVRKAVFGRLKDVSIQLLSIKQRAAILKDGLSDRDSVVQEAALKMLLRWYEIDCGKDALRLLELLDVETYADEAILAVHSLIVADAFDAVQYAKAASTNGTSLQHMVSEVQLLDPATALLWRCVCVWLHGDATAKGMAAASTTGAAAAVGAATAADRHEVLEAVLPQSAEDTMAIIMHHAAKGPQHRFAAMQLLHVAATCMDWTDAASRQAVTPTLACLMSADPRVEEHEDEGVQLQGNGGDGAFERAVCDLVMAVNCSSQQFADAMLEALGRVAATWGLSGQEPADSGTQRVAQPCLWLQCLGYAALLLQRCGGRQRPPWGSEAGGSFSLAAMWDSLCLPALRHTNAAVRARAVEVMALYALVPGADAGGAPVVLSTTVLVLSALLTTDALQVHAAAARALCDLSMLLGMQRLDAVLCAPVQAGSAQTVADALAAATASTGGTGNVDGGSVAGVGRGVVGLLLQRLTVLLAGGSPSSNARRASSRSANAATCSLSGDAAELLSLLGEGLAKLLTAQVVWDARGSPMPEDQRVTVLSKLLLLQFHPASEGCTKLHQCLMLFFEVYAKLSAANRAALGKALLPAARMAFAVPVVKKAPAPLVVKLVLQLLCTEGGSRSSDNNGTRGTEDDGGDEEGDVPRPSTAGEPAHRAGESAAVTENTQLAVELVMEAIIAVRLMSEGGPATRLRPYAAALVKALLALPYAPSRVSELQKLQALTDYLAGLAPDGPLGRDVVALKAQLQSMEGTYPGEPLSAEEVEAVITAAEAMPLDLGDESGALAAAGSESGRGTASKKRAPGTAVKRVPGSAARRGVRAKAPLMVEDSGSDAEVEQVLRRPPPRAAAPVYTDASSSGDSSDGMSDSGSEEERPALARQPLAPANTNNTVGAGARTQSAGKDRADATTLAGQLKGLRMDSAARSRQA